MKRVLVTGSAGHLGEALIRELRLRRIATIGIDRLASPFTDLVCNINDRSALAEAFAGVDTVLHTATLHKPHVVTHSMQAFVDTNIAGTLALLEAAVAVGVAAFVFTSTTSVYGDALRPGFDQAAVWTDEALRPDPKNIYGVTKLAAEDLCLLFHKRHALPTLVLRTSRFFPEADDNPAVRDAFEDQNAKTNEFLYRRVELADVVEAHLLAAVRAPQLAFDRFIISATTPFCREDLPALRRDAPAALERRLPGTLERFKQLNWRMFAELGRVYDNRRARERLGWEPAYDFERVLQCCLEGGDPRSPLAQAVGSKRYHTEHFDDGPFPV